MSGTNQIKSKPSTLAAVPLGTPVDLGDCNTLVQYNRHCFYDNGWKDWTSLRVLFLSMMFSTWLFSRVYEDGWMDRCPTRDPVSELVSEGDEGGIMPAL